jgi:CubicO group peptidase (beta-lactamase class C family)
MKFKSLCRLLTIGTVWAALAGAAPPTPYLRLVGDARLPADALRAAIDPLFAPGVGETRALLVLHDGKILAERYGAGFGPESRQLSWSLAKTVTGLLVGIMVGDGRLTLDDPAPVAAWRQAGDPRGGITLRHLLQMRSGLQHVEDEGPRERTDTLRLLVGPGAADQYGYAVAKPLAYPPGSRFNYSSADSAILCGLMTDLLTASRDPQVRRDAMAQFVQARLAGPLGLTSLFGEYDARGTLLGGGMVHMSARDFAKVGELLRQGGRIGERRILPARWVKTMTAPSPANPAYGAQLWLNRPGPVSDLLPGEAPADLFGAVGYRGQFVIVAPSQKLTIVRLGVTGADEMEALRHALARLVQAVPAG